jgi:DNA repair protein RadA/Sms
MTRGRPRYSCRDCGASSPRWAGRCAQCGEWNTIDEEATSPGPAPAERAEARPVELGSLTGPPEVHRPTGLPELDRVLGGGLVASSVTLMAGEPGIGKSTLLLQMLGAMAAQGRRALLVSAEESTAQVRLRAERLGIAQGGLWIAGDRDLTSIRAAVADLCPDVVVVDSVQTISDPEGSSLPGSVTSVRACAHALVEDAKAGGPAIILVGHVTKDGSIAGPRVLEHLVDTVLSFEGDRHHALRLLRAVKNRFGPVGELGMWEMTGGGLVEVADGGGLFLGDRRQGAPGSVVFAAMEGRRPLLVEIQALVAFCAAGAPRRSASGCDQARLGQLLAVLDRRAGLDLGRHDVYVSAVGGVRLSDPGADLAVCLAVASAATGQVVDGNLVVIGEVGLGGELRQVAQTPRRLSEAARLGFSRAAVPAGAGSPPAEAGKGSMVVRPSASIAEALDAHLGRPAERPRLRVVSGAGEPGRPDGGDFPGEAGRFDCGGIAEGWTTRAT